MDSPSDSDELSQEDLKYRAKLQENELRAQEHYDNAVMVLSAGGLGVSFAFVTDIVPLKGVWYLWVLCLAWGVWLLSLGAVLVSHYTSVLALRDAVAKVDQGKIRKLHPRRGADRLTRLLNGASGSLCLVGGVLLILFVWFNRHRLGE